MQSAGALPFLPGIELSIVTKMKVSVLLFGIDIEIFQGEIENDSSRIKLLDFIVHTTH